MSIHPLIDNPLRTSKTDDRVLRGDIKVTRIDGAIGGGKFVSLHDDSVYLGNCSNCPDQCGAHKTLAKWSL